MERLREIDHGAFTPKHRVLQPRTLIQGREYRFVRSGPHGPNHDAERPVITTQEALPRVAGLRAIRQGPLVWFEKVRRLVQTRTKPVVLKQRD